MRVVVPRLFTVAARRMKESTSIGSKLS